MCTTDIHQRYQTLRHLDPWHGAQFGGLRGFSRNQWFARHVSYLHVLGSERENNDALKAAQHVKIMSAFVLRLLLHVQSAKTQRPPN